MTRFQTTRWSVVLQARADGEHARRALDELCRTYRAPIVAYVRSHCRNASDTEDLAQAFFASFLEHAAHARADPARGSFRAFLLTALKNFLRDAADRDVAQKRGGECHFESLDWQTQSDAIHDASAAPDEAFERDWALAVLRAAMLRLQAETRVAGKSALFDHLCEFLIERPSDSDYERIAAVLHIRRNTLAVAVHRLRQRLQALVREELADTTAHAQGLQRELDDLQPSMGALLPPVRDPL